MPATNELVKTPTKSMIHVGLEPAHNALYSLILLHKSEYMSGYSEWITQTAVSLTREQLHTNKIVTNGLFYAIAPRRSWSSFPAYVDHLAAVNPVILRDRVLAAYNHMPCMNEYPDLSLEVVLSSREQFLNYLYGRFPVESVDAAVESEAYLLLKNPPRMQEVIVNHLRMMWSRVLADEWSRRRSILEASVAAYQPLDFSQMTPIEAAQVIVGQPELPEKWHHLLNESSYEQVIFVPSPHLGPYLGNFFTQETLWMLFGARLPVGSQINVPDLSRSELLVRFGALADDTRLQILHLISQEGEICSQAIRQRLDLSQSATSRHLKQLSATGYLSERRREGAKCYQLNVDRFEDTLQALSKFLSG